MMMMSVLAVVLLVLGVASGQSPTLRLLGQRDFPTCAFAYVFIHQDATDPTERYSLIQNQFNAIPFTRDSTYFIHHIGKYLDDFANAPLTLVYDSFVWPREPGQTPDDVFGFESITQPYGFLVFGGTFGNIKIIDFRDYENPISHDIVEDEEDDWFYHRVLWKDCNGDGLKDALTLRAYVNGDNTQTQMLWLQHPESGQFDQTWEKHILNENIADTMLAETTLTSDGVEYDVLVGIGYFTERVTIFWTNDPDGRWDDPSQIGTRVIDAGGNFFDVAFEDLNNDGRLDLLVPLNAPEDGSLLAFEIPDDFRFGQYTRHVLASGFDSRSGLEGGGAPGQAKAFRPVTSDNTKPWILLSGDDEGTAYYFSPNSEDPNDWSYERHVIIDYGEGNIVGTATAADVDGDGYTELFVPGYIRGVLNAYTFAP